MTRGGEKVEGENFTISDNNNKIWGEGAEGREKVGSANRERLEKWKGEGFCFEGNGTGGKGVTTTGGGIRGGEDGEGGGVASKKPQRRKGGRRGTTEKNFGIGQGFHTESIVTA